MTSDTETKIQTIQTFGEKIKYSNVLVLFVTSLFKKLIKSTMDCDLSVVIAYSRQGNTVNLSRLLALTWLAVERVPGLMFNLIPEHLGFLLKREEAHHEVSSGLASHCTALARTTAHVPPRSSVYWRVR